MGLFPRGWYVDMTDPRKERWWDGTAWTGVTRPVGAEGGTAPEGNSGLFEVPNAADDNDVLGSNEVDLEEILVGPRFRALPRTARSAGQNANQSGQDVARRNKALRTLMNVAALLALLLVVSGGTFLFLGQSPSADASVALALSSTLSNRTADVAVTGSVGVGTARVDLTGNGTVNFTQNAAQLALNTSVHGNLVTENEITVGDTVYLDLGPLVSQVVPGKTWIAMNLSQLNQGGSTSPLGIGGGLSTNNPSAILKVLGQRGNTVTALGQSTINGATVQGYSVQVSPPAVAAELAKAHLPSWMQQSVSTTGNLNVSYKVFIAGSGMLYRMTVDLAVPVDGQSLNGVISMDFSNFGAATAIAAPPAVQVAPYQSFLAKF
jgi:hypothetical protein